MIDKQIVLDAFDKFGNPRIALLNQSHHRIPGVKLANDDIVSHMQPDMREFWNDLTIETDLYGYLLTNILGAGEMYGSNLNGDIFYAYPKEEHPTKGLRRYYKTFEHGHVFLNHDNKDPKTSVGKVLFASWNPIMMRVELLECIEKDDPRGIKILQRVEHGEFPKVSMGCFLAGTLVTMGDGTRKPIEEIQVGDMVITHLGRARRVTETHVRPYNGLIYSFSPEAHETIRSTEEHPFLCITRDSVKEDHTRWIKDGVIEPIWVHAKCITDEFLLEPTLGNGNIVGDTRTTRDNYILTPILETSRITLETTVYNIEVEEDESYLVAGLAVHNCRVPFDVCTICRNVARTRDEYCSHLKHDINKILPTGELVAAINDYPRFFDSSKVFVEADRSSGTLAKVAGKVIIEMPEKASTIEKEVTDNQVDDKMTQENPEEVKRGREVDELDSVLPPDILEMLSDFPMPDVMGTFNDLGMKMKPQEFVFIRIRKAGGPAKKMLEENISIEPDISKTDKEASFVSGKNFNIKIAEILRPYIQNRTMYPDKLRAREITHKIFKVKPRTINYIKNAALEKEYATYIKTAVNITPRAMMYTINHHPEYFNEISSNNLFAKTAGIFSEEDAKKCKAALYGALQNV